MYRERHELQEHSFKRMLDHGALKTHYGRKTIVGPDRPQPRAHDKLAQSLEAAHRRVAKKVQEVKSHMDKIAESESKGHGTRLAQRRRALALVDKELKDAQDKHAKLSEQAAALGLPRERAERDFRTQTIMPFRKVLAGEHRHRR